MKPNNILSAESLDNTRAELESGEGIQASNWQLFKGAIFGRDSARVALDLVAARKHPELVQKIIASLLYCQGRDANFLTGEEPGRIHHEHRRLTFDGQSIDHDTENVFWELANLWGQVHSAITTKEIISYGSVDAAPQFVRLVYQFCEWQGWEFLENSYPTRDGGSRTVLASLEDALSWISSRISASDLGLLEKLPSTIKCWETMRDGTMSYLHENGALGNDEAPFASIEVQGLAYDALMYGTKLFPNHYRIRAWVKQAEYLQKQVLELFYLPDKHFFAQAIDRDKHGNSRIMTTRTSLPPELLETSIFEKLPRKWSKKIIITDLIRPMFSEEFLTPVGLRMRSLQHKNLTDYADYQGSLVSWAACSNVLALGLRRYGFVKLAQDIEQRMLEGLKRTNNFVEFWYTMEDGRVHYDEGKQTPCPGKPEIIKATNIPEITQAWTWSAAVRSIQAIENESKPPRQQKWQRELTAECLFNAGRLDSAHLPSSHFHINTQEGVEKERAFLKRQAAL